MNDHTPRGLFVDTKRQVPFVGDHENNKLLSKVSPAFAKLEELNTLMN